MTDQPLSPAAQAVLDAYWASPWDPSLQQEDRYAIAAALRVAADELDHSTSAHTLYAIAAELDNNSTHK
jgi:hypothetical protein